MFTFSRNKYRSSVNDCDFDHGGSPVVAAVVVALVVAAMVLGPTVDGSGQFPQKKHKTEIDTL